MITIEIMGRPVPWTAPYVGKRGTFSKHTVKKHENKWLLKSEFNQEPWSCPVYLTLLFYFAPPKSTSSVRKTQMLNGRMHHIKRPDLSNCIKFIEDCGTGILWDDDSQIISLNCRKVYGIAEKTIIKMSEVPCE